MREGVWSYCRASLGFGSHPHLNLLAPARPQEREASRMLAQQRARRAQDHAKAQVPALPRRPNLAFLHDRSSPARDRSSPDHLCRPSPGLPPAGHQGWGTRILYVVKAFWDPCGQGADTTSERFQGRQLGAGIFLLLKQLLEACRSPELEDPNAPLLQG